MPAGGHPRGVGRVGEVQPAALGDGRGAGVLQVILNEVLGVGRDPEADVLGESELPSARAAGPDRPPRRADEHVALEEPLGLRRGGLKERDVVHERSRERLHRGHRRLPIGRAEGVAVVFLLAPREGVRRARELLAPRRRRVEHVAVARPRVGGRRGGPRARELRRRNEDPDEAEMPGRVHPATISTQGRCPGQAPSFTRVSSEIVPGAHGASAGRSSREADRTARSCDGARARRPT